MASAFARAQDLLAPLRETPLVGNSIAPKQPDVEILAVLMQDTPTTSAAFDALRRNQEWVSVSFAVVAVGPAGFSSVPYTSGKKEKDNESTLPLYSVSETGTTVFATFEKVKNNKDRGKRVLTMEVDGANVPATAELNPGLCLSTFLRDDVFSGSSGFVVDDGETPEVLPAGSFVWLQLGVKNCEQAAKGALLKFKKMKFCRQPSQAMSTAYRLMPRDKEASVDMCKQSASEYPAIAKQINSSGKNTVVGGEVHPRAFLNYNELDQTFTLSGYLGNEHTDPEVVFAAEQLLREHDFYDPNRFVRWLNCVAIPGKAVGVVVLAQTKYDDDSVAYKGAAMHIDLSRILLSQQLQSMEQLPLSGHDCGLDVALGDLTGKGDLLMWSDPSVRLSIRSGDQERRIVFALQTKPVSMRQALNSSESTRFLSDGCAGRHNVLSVHSVLCGPVNNDIIWDNIHSQVLASLKQRDDQPRPAPTVIVLQLRNENRGVALHKRKRPAFDPTADSRDEDMLGMLALHELQEMSD